VGRRTWRVLAAAVLWQRHQLRPDATRSKLIVGLACGYAMAVTRITRSRRSASSGRQAYDGAQRRAFSPRTDLIWALRGEHGCAARPLASSRILRGELGSAAHLPPHYGRERGLRGKLGSAAHPPSPHNAIRALRGKLGSAAHPPSPLWPGSGPARVISVPGRGRPELHSPQAAPEPDETGNSEAASNCRRAPVRVAIPPGERSSRAATWTNSLPATRNCRERRRQQQPNGHAAWQANPGPPPTASGRVVCELPRTLPGKPALRAKSGRDRPGREPRSGPE
jgi:hypothetical protein